MSDHATLAICLLGVIVLIMAIVVKLDRERRHERVQDCAIMTQDLKRCEATIR
jgi:hypothetical protein